MSFHIPKIAINGEFIKEDFVFDDEGSVVDDLDISLLEKQPLFELERSDHPSWSKRSRSTRRFYESCSTLPLLAYLRALALFLLPSYISRRLSKTPSKAENPNAIAALDGLRGLACLFVFNEHLTYNYTRTFLFGYGVDGLRTVVQWPFVRVLWSGFSMVAIFFVISGYVLSYKPIKNIRKKDMLGFQKTMASAVIRRAFRLYLPTIIAVLLCGFCVYIGVFNQAREVFNDGGNAFQLHEATPPVLDGFFAQMYDALRQSLRMLVIWDWTDSLSAGDYDLHTWTIVVEFRSSMVLFLVIIGISRLKQAARVIALMLFMFFCVMTGRKEVILFVSGMFIAELDMIRKSTDSDSPLLPTSNYTSLKRRFLYGTIWPLMFIAGLFFASVPTIGAESTPGFRTLISITPSAFGDNAAFLRFIGAVLTTWSVANSELLKPVFTNPFTAYLGKISYALYLVHGNVLKSIGYSITPKIYGVTSKDGTVASVTQSGIVVTWLLVSLVVVPVTFWVADVFWRAVDMPCVKFARWVEVQLSDSFDDDMKNFNLPPKHGSA